MSVLYAVNGAKLVCTNGSAPNQIQVTSQTFTNIKGSLVATEQDKVGMVNIPSFGSCRKGIYPTPCTPSPVKWQNTTIKENINQMKILKKDSFCMCSQGGRISFTDTGINQFTDSE